MKYRQTSGKFFEQLADYCLTRLEGWMAEARELRTERRKKVLKKIRNVMVKMLIRQTSKFS